MSEFAASPLNCSKGEATKPTKMYARGGIVKKKGLPHRIRNVCSFLAFYMKFGRI